jgi:phage terminase Nu1 subunit (DNA packaging protein)
MLRLGSFRRVALKRVAHARAISVAPAFLHRGFDIISKSGVTGTALAAHLNCTRETISDYVAKGVIVKLASGKYDQDDCRNRAFDHLRDKSAGRSSELTNERALMAKEQREAFMLKNQISRGDFVSLDQIKTVLIVMFAVIRERLLTIPGKMADACEMRLRAEIEALLREEIIETLHELHDPDFVTGEDHRSDVSRGDTRRPETSSRFKPH